MRVNPTDTAAAPPATAEGTGVRPVPGGQAGPARPRLAAVAAVIARVEVLQLAADGLFRVHIDGREALARSADPLRPGETYVLEVTPTDGTVSLRRPPDGPDLPVAAAAALLREGGRPDGLTAAVKTLVVDPAPEPVRDAARGVLPAPGHPPDAGRLRAFVEHGGLHHEAKLARQAEGTAPAAGPDLKAVLLRLVGESPAQDGEPPVLAAARAALAGIETWQAVNVIARERGGPYVLPVPVQDGDEWRTLHLAVEPDGRATGEPPGSRFRVLLHVELSGLGETWVEAAASDGRLTAVVYLNGETARDRARDGLADLGGALKAAGYDDVSLDVRPTSELPERQRRRGAAMAAGVPESVSILDVRA